MGFIPIVVFPGGIHTRVCVRVRAIQGPSRLAKFDWQSFL